MNSSGDSNEVTPANFWEEYGGDFFGDIIAKEVVRLSRKYIGKKVFDVGAGSGALINLIPNAIGIDIAPKNPAINKGSIERIDFSAETFDTIFATEILEHLDNQTLEKGLCEINRTLKKKGFLVVTVPFKENLQQEFVSCPKCQARFHRWGHKQVFDEQRIKSLLEVHFKLVSIKVLPFDFIVRHRFLSNFLFLFRKLKFNFCLHLYVVAQKE